MVDGVLVLQGSLSQLSSVKSKRRLIESHSATSLRAMYFIGVRLTGGGCKASGIPCRSGVLGTSVSDSLLLLNKLPGKKKSVEGDEPCISYPNPFSALMHRTLLTRTIVVHSLVILM